MKGSRKSVQFFAVAMALVLCITGLPAAVYGDPGDGTHSMEEPEKYVHTIQDETGHEIIDPTTGKAYYDNGNGVYVKAGYEITYRIRFGVTEAGGNGFESHVIMTDKLDGQVSFVSARDYLGNNITTAAPQVSGYGAELKYDAAGHTVTWEAENCYLNVDEYNVYITVRVNEGAEEKVVNDAHFWFSEYGDDKGFDTNEVENPIKNTNPWKYVTGIHTEADRAVTAGNGVEVGQNYKITYRIAFDRLNQWDDNYEWSIQFRDTLEQGASFVEAEDCFGNKITAAATALTTVGGLTFEYDSSSRTIAWNWNFFQHKPEEEYLEESYYIDITVSVNSQAKTKVVNQAEVRYYEEETKKTNTVENPLRRSSGGNSGNNGYYVIYHSETSAGTVSDGRYNSGDTVTVKNGSIFSAPSGKSFAGWAESDGGQVRYRDGETFTMPASTVNLYAVYRGGSSLYLNREDHYAYVVGYQDGTVRPEDDITREEVVTIFFRLLTDETRDIFYKKTNSFSDVASGRWSNIAVSTMVNAGIVSGYPNGTFRPENTITRAEVAVIAAQFDEAAYSGSDLFSDISRHWAREHINKAADLGWVSGYNNGTFRPDEPITRAEMMTLINQVLERNPAAAADLLDEMTKWPDNRDTASWYYIQVQEATNSHYYDRHNGTEYWTQLRATRNWAELERD